MAPYGSYTPPQELAKDYIAEHRVQQMFSSLLSALMMHKPENPVDFIQNTLDEVRKGGAQSNVWLCGADSKSDTKDGKCIASYQSRYRLADIKLK